MFTALFGAISGVLVFGSAIPYLLLVIRNKNEQEPVSWSLWTIIGFALLATYNSSGASGWSLLPVWQAFLNPFLILSIMLWRRHRNRLGDQESQSLAQRVRKTLRGLEWTQKVCLVLGLVAVVVWTLVRADKTLAEWDLYLSLIADVFAAIPTIQMVWRDPSCDKPGAWGIYAIGYAFALLAVTQPTIVNYVLPVYMIVVYGSVACITAAYRIKIRAPLREWI